VDVYARRVIGWAMADHLRTALALDALRMAVLATVAIRGVILARDTRDC
jgi:transposase InsO family protein